jgi:hypothetical protein
LKDILSSNKSGRINVVDGAQVGAPETPEGGRQFYSKLMVYMRQKPKYRGTPFKDAISGLLENNAILGDGHWEGEELGSDYFLCANIKDEDMPWDSAEIDW